LLDFIEIKSQTPDQILHELSCILHVVYTHPARVDVVINVYKL